MKERKEIRAGEAPHWLLLLTHNHGSAILPFISARPRVDRFPNPHGSSKLDSLILEKSDGKVFQKISALSESSFNLSSKITKNYNFVLPEILISNFANFALIQARLLNKICIYTRQIQKLHSRNMPALCFRTSDQSWWICSGCQVDTQGLVEMDTYGETIVTWCSFQFTWPICNCLCSSESMGSK